MENIDLRNKQILLTGGAGFLGKFVFEKLIDNGAVEENIFIPRSKEYDLRKKEVCGKVTQKKDIIIHLAAKVGGIGYNRARPAELFYDNLMMGVQLIEAARINKVKKFVAVGTICAYPKYTPVPFKEEDLWNGYPEETNAPYGLAKKMMLVQSQAYRQQYGFNSIFLLPVNLYGPRDNFDLHSSHVIPALVRKMVNAKDKGLKEIEVWGSGNPTREFLYVEDAAEGIVLATRKYDKSDPINLGNGYEISIRNLTELISRIVGYDGKLIWNKDKPDGQPRRCLDIAKAKKEFGFQAKVNLEEGIKKTVEWYIKNQR